MCTREVEVTPMMTWCLFGMWSCLSCHLFIHSFIQRGICSFIYLIHWFIDPLIDTFTFVSLSLVLTLT